MSLQTNGKTYVQIIVSGDHETVLTFKTSCLKSLSLHLKVKTGLKVDHEKTDLNLKQDLS